MQKNKKILKMQKQQEIELLYLFFTISVRIILVTLFKVTYKQQCLVLLFNLWRISFSGKWDLTPHFFDPPRILQYSPYRLKNHVGKSSGCPCYVGI